MKKSGKNKKKVAIRLLITTIIVYLLFQFLLPLFLPVLFAYLIAITLYPGVVFLESKLHIPKTTGSILLLTLSTSILCYLLSIIIQIFVEQTRSFFMNLPIYQRYLLNLAERLCACCDALFGFQTGFVQSYMVQNMDHMLITVKEEVLPAVTEQTMTVILKLFGIIGTFFIVFLVALLLLKDMDKLKLKWKRLLFYEEIRHIGKKLSETGLAYLKAESIILLVIFCVCALGMFLIKNPYALPLALLIAIVDALPIFGSGTILLPWAIIELLSKDLYYTAILFCTYLACQFIRQILEPKLIGNRIGLEPVVTMVSMYIGFRLFGISGFILGPIGYVLIKTIGELDFI